MWMTLLASGFQTFASIRADDVVPPVQGQAQGQAEAQIEANNVAGEAASAFADGQFPGGEGSMPTAEQLLAVLDSMSGLSDEDKASLREELLRGPTAGPGQLSNDTGMQTITLFSLLGLVVLIFVFFVYKLFKCLQERERKREEKKKNKQLRKKK